MTAGTLKAAGNGCPKCGAKCAEFRSLADTCTRWVCNACGAGGQVTGTAAPDPAPPPRKVHPHWSQRNALAGPSLLMRPSADPDERGEFYRSLLGAGGEA